MNNRILVLISFLFFTISLNAQRTISGVVISGDNQERLPFSDIIIKGTNQGTSTNVDGFFSLIDVPEDSLILQIFYVGYSTKELRIEAGNLDVKNLKIELQSGVQLSGSFIQIL
jgi:hypothetical protein